jgi:hypothetical protein
MPSLFRFLIVLVILGMLGGAAMVYLAIFVGPHTREMTVRIPPDKLQVQDLQPQPQAQQPTAQQPPAQPPQSPPAQP